MTIEQDIKDLNENMHVALGRINAIHAALLVVSKHLPTQQLLPTSEEIKQAAEAIHADALSTPLPDAMLDEMQRVLLELAQVLVVTHNQIQSGHQDGQPPHK